MANVKDSSLTVNTSPATTDRLRMIDDPAGTPASQTITFENFLKVINGLTADSSPDRGADYVVTYDASASGVKKVLVRNTGAYVLTAGFGSFSPADATTYYFGPWHSLAPGGTGGNWRVYVPRTGKITRADIYLWLTAGSAETSTMSLRLNNTTDTTLSSAIACNAANSNYAVTGLSIAVTAGDYFEIKWVTPTWVTNPTSVIGMIQVFVE